MSSIARSPEKHFTPCPEGLHEGVCVDVVDLGLVDITSGRKHRVRLVRQVGDPDPATCRRYDCVKTYTVSSHKKATLRSDLESWFGQKLIDSEAQPSFDLERLLGVNAMVNVLHEAKADRTVFAKVRAVMACQRGTSRPVPVDYTRRQDRLGLSSGSGRHHCASNSGATADRTSECGSAAPISCCGSRDRAGR